MAYEGKARVLTLPEFRRAEKAAMMTRHSLRNKALLYMSFSLALRACELRRLRICDVLAPDGTLLEEINLLGTMTKRTKKIEGKKKKGKKQRHVYLTNKKTRDVLLEYINMHLRGRNIRMDAPLFCSQKGGEFRPGDMVRIFRLMFKDAGLPGARSHSGRRTFITAKINEGVDIRSIALIVGHENINTTVGYHDAHIDKLKFISEKSIF